MWSVARAAGGLDVNTPYAYVLWGRDFAGTTSVVRDGDDVVAYCTGYRRPDDPSALFVWQVAVAPTHRRLGLGRALLDDLVARTGARAVEATVTAGNAGSWRLFTSLADAHEATVVVTELFTEDDFPDGHEAEQLLRIEPLGPAAER